MTGLDLGYTDEQGPCLIKNLRVLGFDVGVYAGARRGEQHSGTYHGEHQNKFGMRNDGQPCTVRDLRSLNQVPAFRAGGGFTVLLDSVLTGLGGAASQPAVIADAPMIARNLQTKGYGAAIQDNVGKAALRGRMSFCSSPSPLSVCLANPVRR